MGRRDKIIWALYINHRCNLRCNYCYLKRINDERVIKKHELFQVIDFIYRYSKEHKKEIELGFFGKEPLLNFEIVRYAVNYIRERNYKIGLSINTNGGLLNKKIFEYLTKNNIKIVLSIDKYISQKDKPNIFKSLYKNDVRVRTTVNSHNISHLPEILTDFNSSGFFNVSIAFDYTDKNFKMFTSGWISGRIIRSLLTYIQIKESNMNFSVPLFDRIISMRFSGIKSGYISAPFCQLGSKILSVDINGDIYPCWRFISDRRYILGNALKGEFADTKYQIEISREDIKHILPFDYICYWTYIQDKYMLRNNLKILSALKEVIRAIR